LETFDRQYQAISNIMPERSTHLTDGTPDKDAWMRRIVQACLLAGAVSVLGAIAMRGVGPAFAVSPKVQAAIKSLEKIEAQGAMFQAFCKLLREIEDVPEQDEANAEALDVRLQALLRSISLAVLRAWDLESDLDPQSEDGQAFEAAIEALEKKCPD